MSKIASLVGVSLAVTALSVPVLADESNPAIVHRQSIYKVVSGHMGGLKSGLLLKDGPVATLSYHAEGIVAAYQHFGDNAWPAGSDKGETKAKSSIWTDRATFDKKGKDSYAAALALVAAAKGGNKGETVEAFKALGGTCKACHDDFRND